MTLFTKQKTLRDLKKLKKTSYSTILILDEAERHSIKWQKIAHTDMFTLQYKDQVKYFHAQIPSETTEFAFYSCKNKRLTKNILEEAGISVSKGYHITDSYTNDHHSKSFNTLVKPVVIKPIDDKQGANVYLDIYTQKQYKQTLEDIYNFYGTKKIELLVEQMFIGDEYRILATQEKILSVIKRLPANVVGTGTHTIKELIKIKNQNPTRIEVVTYKPITIDSNLESYLKNQDLSLESIPEKNSRIFLLPHTSLDMGLGGDTIDVTDTVHPSVTDTVSKIMKSIPGLSLAGIDYMTTDIESEQTPANYIAIEINTSPCLDWNQYPLEGPQRPIAYEFLKIMFPELE